ncbi:hypothetical protein AAZX31_08G329000 [Glycine max]
MVVTPLAVEYLLYSIQLATACRSEPKFNIVPSTTPTK